MLITENQLDEWVRTNARDAQGVIVELVWRLVAASSPKPKERRFPLGDSIGQPGPDGVLNVDFPFEPFVPVGRSYWEISAELKAMDKATSDYKKLTAGTPEAVRQESTFVFVTPLSGRRDWQYAWKKDEQAAWIEEHRARGEWRNILVNDGTKIIDWLHQFPAVERWLVYKMGLPTQQIEMAELYWNVLQSIGAPPPLIPQVFLTNREQACAKIKEVFDGKVLQLKLQTRFPEQVFDFVAAYMATLEEETRVDVAGLCLLISSVEAWNAICEHYKGCILVAAPNLDFAGHEGAILLEKARRAGHRVIYGSPPGGIPEQNAVPLLQPKVYELNKALVDAGYNEERARILAQKSSGNLSSLLKLLQNISLIPEWARAHDAADMAVAVQLGAWNEKNEADCRIVETLASKPYLDWIKKIRELGICSGTPLTYQDGKWKFILRYEGWCALGLKLFDDHLDRLRSVTVTVLREKDPKFDLSVEDRPYAQIYRKTFTHSQSLRRGLAESLAFLGSHPKTFDSTSFGKAEATTILAVRETLQDADWVLWASLDDVLPLLAEAAPKEFLNAVEEALGKTQSPFDEIFAQESSGTFGATYISGLLWALETLAWDPDHLIRAVSILGALAARDPGGNWANRPSNSLTTILLPWLPQTCAPIAKRRTAVTILLNEQPDVGWKLLLTLLPQSHSVSSGTRKPAWRDTIPDDWREGVTHAEYWEQINGYAELSVKAAEGNAQKLSQLIGHLAYLPPSAQERLLNHIKSETILALPEADRMHLWTTLVNLVTQHKRFADANWALGSDQANEIAAITERIAPQSPVLRHKRLFDERIFDLYEEQNNYEEQAKKLEVRRQRALLEITETRGTQAVINFAKSVYSPWNVGYAFGFVAGREVDAEILPSLLNTKIEADTHFIGGFVLGRFRSQGWPWANNIDTQDWTSDQIGDFLCYLPFSQETWEFSAHLLGSYESLYWKRTTANPYEAQSGLELAIDKLIKYGRPHAAIRCLAKMLHDKQPPNSTKAVCALLAALNSTEDAKAMDVYEIVEIIKALQDDPKINPDDLFRVEWAYLPLLEQHLNASPKLLERRLASDPEFFCEVICLVFRPRKEERSTEEPTEQAKNIARNAYRLLSNWRTPPGLCEDGSYDGEALVSWLDIVKRKCAQTGHLEIAMQRIGHVLMYAPPDPAGLCIHRSVAAVLNAEDSDEMRVGFRTELFNSRGVHWVDPTGKPERELAAKFRMQAEEIEVAGYHRLGTTLRELAESYENEAERILSRELFDE